jgi:acyl dehydratase
MSKAISASDLPGMVGSQLEASDWLEITQERVNQFADATNDHQFIHIDPDAARSTPFGGPIAHGFLSLSLLSYLNAQNGLKIENAMMGINYGSDKVRYLMPVSVGKRIRSHQKLTGASEKSPGQWLIKTDVSIEIEGEETPALVAEILSMIVVG